MPKLNGFQATLEIRKFLHNYKMEQPEIVGVTTSIDDSILEKAK